MFTFPNINGEKVSYANIEIKLAIKAGVIFRTADITALDWEDGVEITDVAGCGSLPVGHAFGAYTKSASMTMLAAKYQEFQNALAAVPMSAAGLCTVPFDIIAQWTPMDPTTPGVLTCKIVGARIMGRQSSNAPGSDPASRVITLFPSLIEDGGKRLINR